MTINVRIVVFNLLFVCLQARSIRIVSKAVLLSASHSIIWTNLSESQCLCQTLTDTFVINYFSNGTCQLFTSGPCPYEVKIDLQSQIYLLDASFDPFQPRCSMNGTQLIRALNTSTFINISAISGWQLVIDDHGYLVVLISSSNALQRYDPLTLTLIDQISVIGTNLLSFSHFNGTYFVGLFSNNISVIDSTTLAVVSVISSSYLQGPRDMIFLDGGQTMVVASYSNDYLVFFNRSVPSSRRYSYIYRVPFPYRSPFGLWRVNDTFFYATSYTNNTVLSYSAVNRSSWNENLVIDMRPITASIGGSAGDITIDPCGRFWISLGIKGLLIYDHHGSYLGRYLHLSFGILDLVITNNFTIYYTTYFSVVSVVCHWI